MREPCSRIDHRGETCVHRWAAGYALPNGFCRGCVRRFMDALAVEFPDLDWAASWFARADLPTEEVALQ